MDVAIARVFSDPAVASFAVRLVCGVSVAWLAAGLVSVALRRGSAAVRHRVWGLGVLAALLLPGLIAVVPERRVGGIELGRGEAGGAVVGGERGAAVPATVAPAVAPPPAAEAAAAAEMIPPQRAANRPAVPAPVPGASVVAASAAEASPVPVAPARPMNWRPLALAACVAPTVYLLLRQVVALCLVRRLVRRAVPAGEEARGRLAALCRGVRTARVPRLLESAELASPICTGVLRPAILLPERARDWPVAQVEAVLTHELAHVARRDVLWQTLARLACAAYWFHPLAWVAAWRMRVERELACDDWVLRAGESPTAYARHLLDVATAAVSARRAARAELAAVAMASRSNFEQRIVAILDPARRRLPVTRRGAAVMALAAMGLLAAAATLSPLAPGRAVAQAPNADPDFPPLKIIHFDVVDLATNRPVDNVKLTATVGTQRRTWTTDDDGHAKLDVSGDVKTLTVRTQREGYVPVTVSWAPSHTREPLPDQYLLKLERGTTIGGRVVDEAGKPIVGAGVEMRLERVGEEPYRGYPVGERVGLLDVSVRTGLEGEWHYDLAPGNLKPPAFRLRHPDFLSDERYREPPVTVTVEKLRDRSAVLVMSRGVRVAGRVVDETGSPVPNARLVLGDNKYGLKPPSTKADAQGRFELPHCRPGQRADLVATAAGRAPALKQFTLERDVTGLEIRMGPARRLAVRVVDPKGKPLAGTRLWAKVWRGTETLSWEARTDVEGRAAWPDAPAEPVTFGVYLPGYVQLTDKSLTAGDQEQVVTLLPELVVRGTVVDDATGRPVESFRVLRGWTSFSNDRAPFWGREEEDVTRGPGRFELKEDVERFAYAVRVEAAGYLPADSRLIKADEGVAELQFRLKKGADLVGTVHGPDGRPLADAGVLIATASSQIFIENGALRPNQTMYCEKARTDAGGRFRFGAQAGKFRVLVVHPAGYGEFTPEQVAQSPVLTLAAWARVEGVVRVGARPAAGQEVVALAGDARDEIDHNAHRQSRATADGDGRFVLERVRPGPTAVSIYQKLGETTRTTRYGYTQTHHVDLKPGETARVMLGGAGRPVVGRLVAPAGVGDAVDWHHASPGLSARLDEPKTPHPPGWDAMDPAAREAWLKAWRERPEVREANERYMREARRRRYFLFPIRPDGSFRVEDVPAGEYEFTVSLSAGPSRDTVSPGPTVGSARRTVTVPTMPAGRSDEPLDLGEIQLAAAQAANADAPATRPANAATKPATAPAAPAAPAAAPAPGAGADPAAGDVPALKILHLDVVDVATNRPLADVKLSATVDRQQRVWTTDDAGHAALDVPGDVRAMTVRAEKDGYVPLKVSWAPVQTKEPLPAQYLLKLERGNAIGGRVVDQAGKPVADVAVDLYLFRKGDPEAVNGYPVGEAAALFDVKARTDDDGRWSYPLAPRELVRPMFRLTHPDYLADEWFRPAPQTASPERLRDGSAIITISRGVRVAGRVVDERGQGVANARVVLGKAQRGFRPPPETRSDAEGRFELSHCRPGQRADLLVGGAGRAPALRQFQLDRDVTRLEVRTEPARRLALRAVDPKGQPLAAVRVTAKLWRGTELLEWSGRTGRDGRLEWADAPADAVVYEMRLAGYMGKEAQPLTATDGEQVVTLYPELTVRGTVVDDETGRPVESFRVVRGYASADREGIYWARERPDVKTEPGKFEVKEVEKHPAYAVAVEALGYRPAESRRLKADEGTVLLEFRLKKGPDLAAMVLAADGKPLAGADVLVATGSGQIFIENGAVDRLMTQCRLQSKTDAAGRFRLPAQVGDHRVLVVHPAGYVELSPGQLAAAPTITAPAWGRIEGTARIGARPAAGVRVEAFFGQAGPGYATQSTFRRAAAVADADGRYVLDRVYPGEAHVGIVPKRPPELRSQMSGPSLRRTVRVEAGRSLRVDLGGTGRPVTARLVPPAGAVDQLDWYYAHATLTGKAPWAGEYYFLTPIARDGAVRFEDVPPGVYEFSATLMKPPPSASWAARERMAGVKREVVVPEVAGGRSEEAVELGEVRLEAEGGSGGG